MLATNNAIILPPNDSPLSSSSSASKVKFNLYDAQHRTQLQTNSTGAFWCLPSSTKFIVDITNEDGTTVITSIAASTKSATLRSPNIDRCVLWPQYYTHPNFMDFILATPGDCNYMLEDAARHAGMTLLELYAKMF
eukprot:PhF_6_TR15082/c0_g1_i1/m.23722